MFSFQFCSHKHVFVILCSAVGITWMVLFVCFEWIPHENDDGT